MEAFLFYIDDWLSSTKIAAMTGDEERGYLRLLLFAAKQPDCGIPNDTATLSRISMLGSKWRKSASKIRACFIEKNGRLYNERLLREFERQQAYLEARKEGGRKAAQKRWLSGSSATSQLQENGGKSDSSTIAELMQGNIAELMQGNMQTLKPCSGEVKNTSPDARANGFDEFITAWDAACKEASPWDWGEARKQWKSLNMGERLRAIRRLVELREYPDDPARTSLPQNYLERQMWHRSPRGKPRSTEPDYPEFRDDSKEYASE